MREGGGRKRRMQARGARRGVEEKRERIRRGEGRTRRKKMT